MTLPLFISLTFALGQSDSPPSDPALPAKVGCPVPWLQPWTASDLEMKPIETVPEYCGCKRLFWCPKEAKEAGNDTHQDEKPAENQAKKDGDEEKKDEVAKLLTPAMQLLQRCLPKQYDRMEKRGDNFYGWIQQGVTFNYHGPADRINYGANFNWRSNDYRLNQIYLVHENTLEHEGKPNVGYRIDFVAGHDAPFLVANGLFSSLTGFDPTSGFGAAGPASFRQMNAIGIDLPQFYWEAHIPYVITDKGIDVRIGKFYTLMGREVYPGKDTDFYSRTFENIVGTAYTHTGILTTLHATDTLDVVTGVVQGWDVFEDNNNRPSFHNAIVWTSCNKRVNWFTTFTTGPEQFNNDTNYRNVVTSYLTIQFGGYNQFKLVTGGLYGYEVNAALDPAGNPKDAQWYDYSVHMFHTISRRLTTAFRLEWFRDDDGARTAYFGRPGFAASFFNATAGFTYKPYQNLRFRPELRIDWTPHALPFNDQTRAFQVTSAMDVIWEF